MKMKTFIDNISYIRKLKLLDSLKIDNETVNSIENQTKEQEDCPQWFKQRKHRFTAYICNKSNSVKTNRGLSTLAHSIVFEKVTKKNKTLERKPEDSQEPIGIPNYGKYFKSNSHDIKVEPCGLVIDEQNYILGAISDGKVSFNDSYSILESKASEEYKNVDPKDVFFISKNPCIRYCKNSKNVTICKTHSYYDQIQMLIALTCQSFCNFIFCTNKGMVIDQVKFDESAWNKLRQRVLKFYFNYLLDNFILRVEKEIKSALFIDDIPLLQN